MRSPTWPHRERNPFSGSRVSYVFTTPNSFPNTNSLSASPLIIFLMIKCYGCPVSSNRNISLTTGFISICLYNIMIGYFHKLRFNLVFRDFCEGQPHNQSSAAVWSHSPASIHVTLLALRSTDNNCTSGLVCSKVLFFKLSHESSTDRLISVMLYTLSIFSQYNLSVCCHYVDD